MSGPAAGPTARTLFRIKVAPELLAAVLERGTDAATPETPMVGARVVGCRPEVANWDGAVLEFLVYLPRADGGQSWNDAPEWLPVFRRTVGAGDARARLLPEHIRSHEDLPEAAWAKREEIWQCESWADRKRLVLEFADILRAEANALLRQAAPPLDREAER